MAAQSYRGRSHSHGAPGYPLLGVGGMIPQGSAASSPSSLYMKLSLTHLGPLMPLSQHDRWQGTALLAVVADSYSTGKLHPHTEVSRECWNQLMISGSGSPPS